MPKAREVKFSLRKYSNKSDLMVYILLIIRIGYVEFTYVRCSSINRRMGMLLAFLYNDVKKCLLHFLIFFKDSRSPTHADCVLYQEVASLIITFETEKLHLLLCKSGINIVTGSDSLLICSLQSLSTAMS